MFRMKNFPTNLGPGTGAVFFIVLVLSYLSLLMFATAIGSVLIFVANKFILSFIGWQISTTLYVYLLTGHAVLYLAYLKGYGIGIDVLQ